jgi:hypothetical protein
MSKRMTTELFVRTVERAVQYRVDDLEALERIAGLLTRMDDLPIQPVEFDESYRERPAYREGELAGMPDLSIYDDAREEESDGRDDGEDAEGAAAPCAP